jgi:hypothetical protein
MSEKKLAMVVTAAVAVFTWTAPAHGAAPIQQGRTGHTPSAPRGFRGVAGTIPGAQRGGPGFSFRQSSRFGGQPRFGPVNRFDSRFGAFNRFDSRFSFRQFDRIEDRLERQLQRQNPALFRQFDRIEDRLENRLRFDSRFGFQ